MEVKKDAAKKAEELQSAEKTRELAEEELNQVAGGETPAEEKTQRRRMPTVQPITEPLSSQ